ncbi:MAG TPA: hypothetical protein VFE14_20950 [Micromonosporaceae bacterium]|jgi:hypothetical protein|nr:hypothetical protein [Micromonosporaceae bacterium]
MGGFLAGSLVLIVLYVLVQPGAASKVESASGLSLTALRHALSPEVAGISNRAARAKPGQAVGPGAGIGGGAARAGEAIANL